MSISFIERDLTEDELHITKLDFENIDIEHNLNPNISERLTVVASDGDLFIGCASGLKYHNWFCLTDMWIKKEYRGQGFGSQILERLENILLSRNCRNIHTWTKTCDAPDFYKKMGYKLFAELEDYHAPGISNLNFCKRM